MIDEVIRAGTVRYRSVPCPDCGAAVGNGCPGDVPFPHGGRWLALRRVAGEIGKVTSDPQIRDGEPCIAGTRIPAWIIAERWQAGDTVDHLAKDYNLAEEDIRAAIASKGGAGDGR